MIFSVIWPSRPRSQAQQKHVQVLFGPLLTVEQVKRYVADVIGVVAVVVVVVVADLKPSNPGCDFGPHPIVGVYLPLL